MLESETKDEENKFMSDFGRKVWQFKSSNNVEVNVTFNSIDVTSPSHKSYCSGEGEKFRDLIQYAIGAFNEIFNIPMISRIGLRYIDNGPLPSPFNNTTFSEYYNSALPLNKFNLVEATEMVARSVVKKDSYQLAYVELLDFQSKILVIDFDAFAQNIPFVNYLETADHLYEIIHEEYYRTIKEPVKEIMRGK